ncbi:MAG: rod shape-determining protein MreD [Muribaculaceae bacterium]|nr:rod shape-determining protein MreD [Muribaculaceae bacterium]MDE6771191.1 rod shape-determining protein MreD [Muribaculaceae bacterium]
MSNEVLRFSVLFVIMLLIQVLICNHIALFNVAVPIVFIYFIIRLPIDIGKGFLFTLAFLLGLCIDICSDTLGVNSLATTLLAAFKRPIFFAYVQRDDKTKSLVPSISSLGVGTYCKYLVSMIGIYCIMAFSIEYFNFADVKEIVILSASSCCLTFIILLAIDCLIINKS